MEQKELLELLKQKEGPKLEFKQEMYHIHEGAENRVFQKHEMIRDILALANGNPSHAWAEGYLIIGATDHFVNDRRELIGVTPQDNLESQIIQIVNDACNPKLSHLSCEYIDVDGVTLLIITVPRTPYIVETTKTLTTKGRRGEDGRIEKQEYSEHVVFVRLGEAIKIASDQIRQELQQRKRFFVQESFKVYPGVASAASSALVTGIIVGQLMTHEREDSVVGIGMGLGAALVAAVLGGALGEGYGRLLRINSELQGYPKHIRWLLLAATILFAILCGLVGNWLADKMRAPR